MNFEERFFISSSNVYIYIFMYIKLKNVLVYCKINLRIICEIPNFNLAINNHPLHVSNVVDSNFRPLKKKKDIEK